MSGLGPGLSLPQLPFSSCFLVRPSFWAFSRFPETRAEEELPKRMRVGVIGWNARSSIFMAGKEKERG